MWIAIVALAAACSRGESDTLDPGAGADAGAVFVDAAPAPDAPPPDTPAVQMYVHSADILYTIDDDSFALTVVGAFGNGADITDLAVTPDGTLYGISQDALWLVDRDTAAATFVAEVPGVVNVGLTFLPDGTLLATDKEGGVRRVHPVSGLVTEVGVFGGGYATAGDLVAVADGTMFAISDEGPVGDEFDNNWLLTVDTASGAATPIGQIGYGSVFGAAFAGGKVYAFTRGGEVIEIDRTTGAGALVADHPVEFWGAGVTPLVVVE